MSNILTDEQLKDDIYFDISVKYDPVKYCPTAADPEPYGGYAAWNTIEPPLLPTAKPMLTAGASYTLEEGCVFLAPGIQIHREDQSKKNEDIKVLLKTRKPLFLEPMYLEVMVRSHAQTRKSDRAIKMYVAELNDICSPSKWQPINTTKEGQTGGTTLQLGDIDPHQTAWTAQRFLYVRMIQKAYYLIAQITDVTGVLNPLPKDLIIDPNTLQNNRQWCFLRLNP